VTPVDPEGRKIHRAESTSSPASSWTGTLWAAALDAAEGERWPERGGAHEHRRTQGRRLELGAALFGLVPETPERTREHIAMALSVPLLSLREAASAYATSASWTVRARCVVRLLDEVPPHRAHIELLVAGHVAGLWGRPSRWDPGGALRPLP
jgi:hypothetical protein